jgi:hypothetical protein
VSGPSLYVFYYSLDCLIPSAPVSIDRESRTDGRGAYVGNVMCGMNIFRILIDWSIRRIRARGNEPA